MSRVQEIHALENALQSIGRTNPVQTDTKSTELNWFELYADANILQSPIL